MDSSNDSDTRLQDPRGTLLPTPSPGAEAAESWVGEHLADLASDQARPSRWIRGGQVAAERALTDFEVRGYASRRNEVWPRSRRGASGLSPYIRHGLLTLPRVWAEIEGGPARDVRKFRDELLWQEYARHLYARLGPELSKPLRSGQRVGWDGEDPWRRDMRCIAVALDELEGDGWLVNQTRMWLASQWGVRRGAPWRDGEDRFFRHLLDGSRAANRLGWQWTVGVGSGRPYGFSRHQVEKRAPGLCEQCRWNDDCPIARWPRATRFERSEEPAALRRDDALALTSGPNRTLRRDTPELVWLTAESLGFDDPALGANPELAAVFVFDAPLLARLRLSRKRLIFLTETLAELAARRELQIHRGAPAEVLSRRKLAATFAPVPGWRRLAPRLDLAEIHPWPWLRPPHAASIRSFSAWRKTAEGSG